MNLQTALVAEYAPIGTSAEQLLQYPFARPDHSYCTDGETVTVMPDTFSAFTVAADELLTQRGVPVLAERTPVVAYGANASPVKLTGKMGGKFTPEELRGELQIVPSIMAEMDETAIVWHGKPGQTGSVFAELYRSPETAGVVSSCFVQFLTNEQIALLHASEGVTYHFAPLSVRVGSDSHQMEALAYVAGMSEVLLDKAGKPILVKPLTKEAGEVTMTAHEAVAYMLENAGEAVETVNPIEYIETAPKTLAEKKARQAKVRKALGEAGLSAEFSFPGTVRRGRADFNGSDGHANPAEPYSIQLMEDVLSRLSTTTLVSVIRKRAHDELAQLLKHE